MYDNFGTNQGYGGMDGNPSGDMVGGGRRYRRPSRREIMNWFQSYMGAREMDLVDEADCEVARHVCAGGNNIELLPRQTYNLTLEDGSVVVLEYYQCNLCGKLILDKNFI